MTKMLADASLLDSYSSKLGKCTKDLETLGESLEKCVQSIRANQALDVLDYDEKVDAVRRAMLAYADDIKECAEAMDAAAVFYCDAELFAIGALEGKTPMQVLFGDNNDADNVLPDYEPELEHRFRFGPVYIEARAGGFVNELIFGGIRDIVYSAKGVPYDAYKHWDPRQTIKDYFSNGAGADGGIGREGEDGVRTVGGRANAGYSFWTGGLEVGVGEDENNGHAGFNLTLGEAQADAGVAIDSKGNSRAGWNFGANWINGEAYAGGTVHNVRGDVLVSTGVGAGSDFGATGSADEGKIDFGFGIEAILGVGMHGRVQDLDRVPKKNQKK